MRMVEGYETVLPAIPRELRRVDPETLAFLRLIWDMGVRTVSRGHLAIKSALFESLVNPDFLERPEEYIYARLAKLRRTTPEAVESSLRFALGKLWEDCDPQVVSQTYFPNDAKMPEPHGNIESLRVLAQMYEMTYFKYLR